MNQVELRFDGATYNHERDSSRLGDQMLAVYCLMKDGQPRTLAQIAAITSAPEASVSARLRDLRKPRFGGYQIDREYISRGLFRYRMAVQQEEAIQH
jgi:hypothetical protein